jgi:hypothetical protein
MKIQFWILSCFILTACVSPDPRRQQYIAAHPDLDVKLKDCISEGVMCNGLTQEAVRLIWGNPDAINQLDGGREEWIYQGNGQFSGSSDSINFDKDGRVKTWQRLQ